MPSENSTQMISGKAFKFALLEEFFEELDPETSASIHRKCLIFYNQAVFYVLARKNPERNYILCELYRKYFINLEPRLSNRISDDDILQLELQNDTKGKIGDVLYVIIIHCLQKWEIGMSVKVSNDAVKHFCLSGVLGFGEERFYLKKRRFFNAV